MASDHQATSASHNHPTTWAFDWLHKGHIGASISPTQFSGVRHMHDTAQKIGCAAINLFLTRPAARVMELGSLDVNGSLRGFAPDNTIYLGIDLEDGPGVDVVVVPGSKLPVEDDSIDLVIASSVLEHDSAFWVTFLEMCRAVRPGGYIYINVPSNGAIHRYPEDHWRFYPDSGKALARWARSQSQSIDLVESFTANREADIWNDFVAIFRKKPLDLIEPVPFLYAQFPTSTNIQVGENDDLLNQSSNTEDMNLIEQTRGNADRLRCTIAEMENLLDCLRTTVAEQDQQIIDLKAAVDVATAERNREALQSASARDALTVIQAALSDSQAALLINESVLVTCRSELAQATARLVASELEDSETSLHRQSQDTV